ncbi:hypothetical protein S101395_02808 [Bacillus sonorensis]|uniref:Uncharacterized protein n=1 Tax=Bacillus sonorensis TaxID=119858 RepID=A0ABM6LIZ7_9BACI|nr:hypothetical protein S101395_02808 [Bacillus sonorensis]
MFYLGIALFIWLAIGFLAGMKMVFVDQILERDMAKEAQKELDQVETNVLEFFIGNKMAFIAAMTLLGAVVVVVMSKETIKSWMKN